MKDERRVMFWAFVFGTTGFMVTVLCLARRPRGHVGSPSWLQSLPSVPAARIARAPRDAVAAETRDRTPRGDARDGRPSQVWIVIDEVVLALVCSGVLVTCFVGLTWSTRRILRRFEAPESSAMARAGVISGEEFVRKSQVVE